MNRDWLFVIVLAFKPVYMTTDEARESNKKLVEVKTTKRYVKISK